ncbi:MAG: transglutaminase-like domain-containing protein [Cryomorphaceae bacterium]
MPRSFFRFFLYLASVLIASCGQQLPTDNTATNSDETPARKADIAEIEAGIRAYIAKTAGEREGIFPLPYEDDTLRLNLVRVHTEYLSNLGPGRFFACVDLADEGGDVYDVDFFLEGEPGNMSVTQTTVHKQNGKPFYSWQQLLDKTWKRVPVEASSNRLMGVIEGEDRFTFRYAVTLPEKEGSAKLWIPIATSDAYQEVKLISVTTPSDSGNDVEIKKEFSTDSRYGNRILHLDLSGGYAGKEVVLEYRVHRTEKGPYLDAESDPLDYLTADTGVPVGGRFEEITGEIFAESGADSPLMKARAIYDYIIDTVRYRKAGEYGTGDANFACDSKSGNCTEFHSLFISLARTAGIPARFAIGAALPSERNEGGVDGYHCWAEFFAQDKWWPIDISEGNKYAPLATYYFGHHPANRIEISKGRDILPQPAPASGSIPFFAYPVLEIDGVKQQVKTEFSFERKAGTKLPEGKVS